MAFLRADEQVEVRATSFPYDGKLSMNMGIFLGHGILWRPNEFRDTNSLSTVYQRPSRRSDERVEFRETSCPYDGKLFFKANEPQVCQWHEDVEGKREYSLDMASMGTE
jgi:hypothetical protein